MAIVVTQSLPSPEEFYDLRIASGLTPFELESVVEALPRSLFAVCLRDGSRLVGMGRAVGDGMHVSVTDIAVHPDYQGQGLSRTIMEEIMGYVETLPECSFISLFADVDWLYEKFGFTEPLKSTGLALTTRPN